jgi:hypothetical protein
MNRLALLVVVVILVNSLFPVSVSADGLASIRFEAKYFLFGQFAALPGARVYVFDVITIQYWYGVTDGNGILVLKVPSYRELTWSVDPPVSYEKCHTLGVNCGNLGKLKEYTESFVTVSFFGVCSGARKYL